MLANIEKKSLLLVLATGSCSAIISLAALTADVNAGTIDFSFQVTSGTVSTADTMADSSAPQNPGNCLFTTQLATDPALKAAFTKKISAIKDGLNEESYDDAVIYATDIEAGSSSGSFADSARGIDSLSHDCLSCHDGVMARGFNVRVKNNPNGRVMSLEDIIGGHPVGMEYENYASVNGKEYRGEVKFSNEMVFAE